VVDKDLESTITKTRESIMSEAHISTLDMQWKTMQEWKKRKMWMKPTGWSGKIPAGMKRIHGNKGTFFVLDCKQWKKAFHIDNTKKYLLICCPSCHHTYHAGVETRMIGDDPYIVCCAVNKICTAKFKWIKEAKLLLEQGVII